MLADKSEFGWKTLEEYSQYELAENEDNGMKIRRSEERAETVLKSASARKTIRQVSSVFSSSIPRFTPPSHRASSGFISRRGQLDRQYFLSCSFLNRPSRPENCFAWGKFGH